MEEDVRPWRDLRPQERGNMVARSTLSEARKKVNGMRNCGRGNGVGAMTGMQKNEEKIEKIKKDKRR